MENPVVIRSHGGRARAITAGHPHRRRPSLELQVLTSTATSMVQRKSNLRLFRIRMIDAKYADQVVAITDSLVPYPNTPISIPQTDVDYVVVVDEIGDPKGISQRGNSFHEEP